MCLLDLVNDSHPLSTLLPIHSSPKTVLVNGKFSFSKIIQGTAYFKILGINSSLKYSKKGSEKSI